VIVATSAVPDEGRVDDRVQPGGRPRRHGLPGPAGRGGSAPPADRRLHRAGPFSWPGRRPLRFR
jgi:hypothetical protein